jgi:hypothetical protein
MPPFVPNFDCDLFISSARADVNLTAGSGKNVAGWADELSQGLQSLLAQKLGSRDWGVVAGTSISDGLPANELIHRSAALLVVLTHEYLQDDGCLAALDTFVSSLGGADPTGQVLVVLADDIERESWPTVLQHNLPIEFLTISESSSGGPPARRQRLQTSDKLYPVRLDDLSAEVALCLERLKADAMGSPQADTPTVYLGTPSLDVVALRDSLRRYLIQEGIRVAPNRWCPHDAAEFRRIALHEMRCSQLLVQLLGACPLPRIADSSGNLGRLEVEVAVEAGLPVLCWRDPRLDLKSIVDVDHQRQLEGEFVLAVGLEEFKRKVVQRVYAQSNQPATSWDKPLVVVAASKIDRPLAQRVGEILGDKGLGIEIPDSEEISWEFYSNGNHGVGGLVIVYGACPAIWVRQQLWKYRKAMARTESRPPLCAVCEGPPEVKEPLRYDVPHMEMIDCRVQLTDSALSSFIEAVQRRGSQ